MNKKGQGVIIGMSIAAILLVVILGVIFSTINDQISETPVEDDTFTAINLTCVRFTNDCYLAGSLTTENTTSVPVVATTASMTECGDSSLRLFGASVNIQNESNVSTSQNASYTEVSCGFIAGGTTRTLITIISVLLAIVILVFIVNFVQRR